MSSVSEINNLDHGEIMKAFQQIRGDGIDINDLTVAEAEAVFDYYVLGIEPSPNVRALIDARIVAKKIEIAFANITSIDQV